jgi:hypothetical protein
MYESMRTTLNLDEDILRAAKSYAENRSMALGAAVSLLVRRGLTVPCSTRRVNGLLVFDPPADSAMVTAERVRQLQDEEP